MFDNGDYLEFVFHADWNKDLNTDYKEMTVSEKRQYKAYCFFNTYANNFIVDASKTPEQIEDLKTEVIEGTEHVKLVNVNLLHNTFTRARRMSRRHMKQHINAVFGVDVVGIFQEETGLGDEASDPENLRESTRIVATLPYIEREALRVIGVYLTEFHKICNQIKTHVNLLPKKHRKKAYWIEADEVADAFSTFKEQLEGYYEDFLSDSSAIR